MTTPIPAPTTPTAPARPRGGRPPRQGKAARARSLRLLAEEWDELRALGDGDYVAGVRALLLRQRRGPPVASSVHETSPARPASTTIAHETPAPPPRPLSPRPILPPPAASDDLYHTVRAVPKSYSTRDAGHGGTSTHPKSASPRERPPGPGYPPAGTPSKDPADQGADLWWE